MVIFCAISLLTGCGEDNPEVELPIENLQTVQFQNFDEKISYCIGLDHGLGSKQIYGAPQNADKFNLNEIQAGIIDYLSDNDLKIPFQKVESVLEAYLLPDGEVDNINGNLNDASYCVGISEGQFIVDGLVGRGIDQIIYVDFLVLGIEHGIQGTKPLVAPTEARGEILNYYAELNKEQGEAFLAENKTRDSIEVTNSGLQYMIVKEGSGPKPNLTDSCVVHYTGRFLDGRVFDTTIPSKVPATFTPLEVIPGWKEGLMLMKEGAQWRLFVPYELGYGEEGNGPVEPFSLLIFDLELLKVKPYLP